MPRRRTVSPWVLVLSKLACAVGCVESGGAEAPSLDLRPEPSLSARHERSLASPPLAGAARSSSATGASVELRPLPPPARATAQEGAQCPEGYLRVPFNPLYGTQDLCVAKYEMREVDGLPRSVPEGEPWAARDPSIGESRCEALGPGYRLMTNEDWQTVARDIESVAENWSGGAVGAGWLNVGNYSIEHGAASASDRDACATPGFAVRFPSCFDRRSPDFLRKRTHALSTGESIWDIGGNYPEWVSGSEPRVGRGTICSLTGREKATMGPAGDYRAACPPEGAASGQYDPSLAMGYLEGSGGRHIFRGGFWGMEGSAWDRAGSVFYANTNPFWDTPPPNGPRFRCAYQSSAGKPTS